MSHDVTTCHDWFVLWNVVIVIYLKFNQGIDYLRAEPWFIKEFASFNDDGVIPLSIPNPNCGQIAGRHAFTLRLWLFGQPRPWDELHRCLIAKSPAGPALGGGAAEVRLGSGPRALLVTQDLPAGRRHVGKPKVKCQDLHTTSYNNPNSKVQTLLLCFLQNLKLMFKFRCLEDLWLLGQQVWASSYSEMFHVFLLESVNRLSYSTPEKKVRSVVQNWNDHLHSSSYTVSQHILSSCEVDHAILFDFVCKYRKNRSQLLGDITFFVDVYTTFGGSLRQQVDVTVDPWPVSSASVVWCFPAGSFYLNIWNDGPVDRVSLSIVRLMWCLHMFIYCNYCII